MPGQDLEKLVVQLSADIKKYENALSRAQGLTNKRLGDIQKRAQASGAAIGESFAKLGAILVTGATLSAAKDLIDTASRITNALKTAGLEGENLKSVYEQLFRAAQQNAAPIESLVTLFGRLSLVQKELGVDQQALISFTSNVATALRAGGTSAQEASGALLQLSQALGGGVVHAEEFNSILEGAPTIARAAAAGLKEAGGSVATLRNLVIDGKISSQAFFAAFQAGASILDQQVKTSTLTLAQRVEQLRNELVYAAGKFDEATGASTTFGNALGDLADVVHATGQAFVSMADNDVGYFIGKISEAVSEVQGLIKFMGGISGTLGKLGTFQTDIIEGKKIGTTMTDAAAAKEADRIQSRINDAFDNRTGRLPGAEKAGASVPLPLMPVSYEDYPANPNDKNGGKKTKKRGGGGGGGQSDYQREIDQIKERTSALQSEYAAQSQVNPLVDDYGYTIEKARVQHELLAAAQQSGLAITPQLKASIDQLAEGYAQASVQVEKLETSHDRARQAAEDFKNTSKDVVGGFISDLRSGTSAAEALSNALDKVVDKLIDASLNSLFGIGGSGGGLLSLFGFAKGGVAAHGKPVKTFARGGVSRSAAIFGEAGPEAAVPLPDGRSIPVKFQTPAIPKRSAVAPQGVHVTVGVSVDSNGNLMPFVERVSQGQVQRAAPKIVSAASKNVVPTMAAYQNNKAGREWR